MHQLNYAGYDIEIIFQGFPGKAVCHGNLGWSTVALLRGHGRIVLLDTGSMGMRRVLIQRLASYGVSPQQVTDVLLTHSHHDHSINWTLFSKARIVIGEIELGWSLQQPWGETSVPELYMSELRSWPTLQVVADGEEILPEITVHLAPGHTPGSLVYKLRGAQNDVVFTGDAAKNRAELVSRSTDMTYDPAVSAESIRMIWELWKQRPGTIVVPGHDIPVVQEDGTARYITDREAAIRTWFGDDIETMKTFNLV